MNDVAAERRAADASRSRTRAHYRTALAWQVGLAVYMQVIAWIPLGRWNYQPCCPSGIEQLRSGTLTVVDALQVAAFLLPIAVFWVGVRRAWRWAIWAALVAYGVWLALQLATWWRPYFFGASEGWAEVYARAFAQSTAVLPRWGNHLPPDAMHLVLQVLLVGVVISGVTADLRARRAAVDAS